MEEKAIDKKYTDFIEELIDQVSPMLPEDVNELQKNYLIKNIRKSATLMASSMQDDEEFAKLDFDEQTFYIQVIAEWSFHKEIDLFRSGIPAKYWKVVMRKIWYTMWEVMYACVKNDAPHEVTLPLVERFVNRTYRDSVEELKENRIIDEEIEEKAKEQSNIDKMARELQKERKLSKGVKNIIFYSVLFIIISAVVSFVITKFQTYGVIAILTLLVIYHIIPIRKTRE